MKAYSTVEEVLYLAWQDNNTVQLMTTIHTPNDLEDYNILFKHKQHGISADASIIRAKNLLYYILPSVYAHSQPYIERGLPFPTAVQLYNKYIGGSNGNTQGRAYCSPDTRSFHYWWPLLKFLLDASILNTYILWQLQFLDSTLSHVDFQHQVATSLCRNPDGTGRKRTTKVKVIGVKGLKDLEHDWIQLKKRAYCQVCQVNKDRLLKKQKPLINITNSVTKKRRQ